MFHKIGINHETPLALMPEMQNMTDYDYCLVHLTKTNPEYKQYFLDAIAKGRKVLLDNSVFELETPFDPEEFVKSINELNPTWYVVPDFLDDKDKTIASMEDWIKNYLPKVKTDSKIIGSIQGKNVKEFAECYQYMSENEHVAKIAITFNSIAYADMCPDIIEDAEVNTKVTPRNLQLWLEGRPRFIAKLVADRIWNNNKPHHLLGCGYMREFANPLYHRISIETLDTSNPVICGMNAIAYDRELGNTTKPSMKLCDHLNDNLTEVQKYWIKENVRIFREITNTKDKTVYDFDSVES